ncbi:MAG TPA: HAD family hydrolase [Aliiroseovarius sp.]|nr:HAD family hydrolase [Aliiroseovarius sp.]
MTANPLRLVVFDMDGTLIDSQNAIMAAMAQAFGSLGVDLPSREQVLSIVGLSLEEAAGKLMPDLNTADRRAAARHFEQTFLAMHADGNQPQAPLYRGARTALETLHGRDEILMGVATGKSQRGLDNVFAEHDLGRFFVTCQTADFHPSKPHPSMLHAALSETGADASQAVLIGDTTYDIDMARAAGFRTIAVSWGYHSATALTQAGADIVIDEFSVLQDALQALWGAE